MPTDIARLLTSLGLSATETKIYLASLELGPTSVQEIAKKAKLSRTAAYDAIELLQQRGLLSTFEREKKRYFTAEDPESAVAHFKERILAMQQQVETLARTVPELKLLVGGERPTVRFYEGKEGLYAYFHDTAKANPATIDEVTNLDDIYAFFDPKDLAEARNILNPKKSRIRILHRGHIRTPREGVDMCELSPELGDFHGDIVVYGNRVAFVSFVGKASVVIIESQAFADTARVLFEAAWRICGGAGSKTQ